jgi:hypothetical protein
LVRIYLTYYSWYPAAFLFVGLHIGGLAYVYLRRTWVMRVAVEGTRVHRWLKPFQIFVGVLAGGGALLTGLARFLAATQGQTYATYTLGPFGLVALWLLSFVIGLLGILAFLIATLQYRAAKS